LKIYLLDYEWNKIYNKVINTINILIYATSIARYDKITLRYFTLKIINYTKIEFYLPESMIIMLMFS